MEVFPVPLKPIRIMFNKKHHKKITGKEIKNQPIQARRLIWKFQCFGLL